MCSPETEAEAESSVGGRQIGRLAGVGKRVLLFELASICLSHSLNCCHTARVALLTIDGKFERKEEI